MARSLTQFHVEKFLTFCLLHHFMKYSTSLSQPTYFSWQNPHRHTLHTMLTTLPIQPPNFSVQSLSRSNFPSESDRSFAPNHLNPSAPIPYKPSIKPGPSIPTALYPTSNTKSDTASPVKLQRFNRIHGSHGMTTKSPKFLSNLEPNLPFQPSSKDLQMKQSTTTKPLRFTLKQGPTTSTKFPFWYNLPILQHNLQQSSDPKIPGLTSNFTLNSKSLLPLRTPSSIRYSKPNMLIHALSRHVNSEPNINIQPPSFILNLEPKIAIHPSSSNEHRERNIPFYSSSFNSNSEHNTTVLPPSLNRNPESYAPIYPASLNNINKVTNITNHPPRLNLISTLTTNVYPPRVNLRQKSYLPIHSLGLNVNPELNVSIHSPRFNLNPEPYKAVHPLNVNLNPPLNVTIQATSLNLSPQDNIPIQPVSLNLKQWSNTSLNPHNLNLNQWSNTSFNQFSLNLKQTSNISFNKFSLNLKQMSNISFNPISLNLKQGPNRSVNPPSSYYLNSEPKRPIHPSSFRSNPDSYILLPPRNFNPNNRPHMPIRSPSSNPSRGFNISTHPPNFNLNPGPNMSAHPLSFNLNPKANSTIHPKSSNLNPQNDMTIHTLNFLSLNANPKMLIRPPNLNSNPRGNVAIQRSDLTPNLWPYIPIQPPTNNISKPEPKKRFHLSGFTGYPVPKLPTQSPSFTFNSPINASDQFLRNISLPERAIMYQRPRVPMKPTSNTSTYLGQSVQWSRPNISINVTRNTSWSYDNVPFQVPRYRLWPKAKDSSVHLPKVNLWPWIPMNTPIPSRKQHRYKPSALPNHHFWPWIPVKNPKDDKTERENATARLPVHNFWPFIPVHPAKNNWMTPSTPGYPTKIPFPSFPNRYNYGEVIYKSNLFYEAQRSGWLPSDRRINWRGNSAVGDQGFSGEDLSGGWYDAADYVKFGTPMAVATYMLLWGLVEYPEAYKSTGLYDDTLANVKWSLDYFLKAHVEKYELYGQVGDPYIDHAFWGRPEDMQMERPAYILTPDQPGSDLAADTATAMALGYLAFQTVDLSYAKKLLEHAIELFEFADFYRGGYTETIGNAWEFYRSYTDEDELAWTAIWLYRATLNQHYLRKARRYYDRMDECWAQSWADKSCSVPVLMYQMTREARYKSKVESIMSQWMPGGTIDYTPKGLAFRDPWGNLRYISNMAFIALRAADLDIRPTAYRTWARSQIHYMLGDGGRSYVVGYGHNPPIRPHHASSSCEEPPIPCTWDDYTKPEPNPHTLFGALVGGPDLEDNFIDSRTDYIHNEVTCEYNAGFQSSLAALKSLELRLAP